MCTPSRPKRSGTTGRVRTGPLIHMLTSAGMALCGLASTPTRTSSRIPWARRSHAITSPGPWPRCRSQGPATGNGDYVSSLPPLVELLVLPSWITFPLESRSLLPTETDRPVAPTNVKRMPTTVTGSQASPRVQPQ